MSYEGDDSEECGKVSCSEETSAYEQSREGEETEEGAAKKRYCVVSSRSACETDSGAGAPPEMGSPKEKGGCLLRMLGAPREMGDFARYAVWAWMEKSLERGGGGNVPRIRRHIATGNWKASSRGGTKR